MSNFSQPMSLYELMTGKKDPGRQSPSWSIGGGLTPLVPGNPLAPSGSLAPGQTPTGPSNFDPSSNWMPPVNAAALPTSQIQGQQQQSKRNTLYSMLGSPGGKGAAT